VIIAVEIAVALERVNRDPIGLGIEAVKCQIDIVRVDQDANFGAERRWLARKGVLLNEVGEDGRVRPRGVV
jgi:hypothetical protein